MKDEESIKPVLAPAQGPPDYPTNPAPDSIAEAAAAATTTEARSPGLVKRAMEKAADGLNRGISLGSNLKTQLSQSQPALPVSTPRRIFSLSRAKGKERATEGERFCDQDQWRAWLNIGSMQMSKLRRSLSY